MNLYEHAASAMPFMTGQGVSGKLVPGLPATTPPGFANRPGLNSSRLGATLTHLDVKRPKKDEEGYRDTFFADVAGQPSMKLVRTTDGSVKTLLRRNSQYADFMTEDNLRSLRMIAYKMAGDAERSSRGPLNRAELRRRGYPYGRGGRRGGLGRLQGRQAGVSNLTIVNDQGGNFKRSWLGEVKADKSGATLALENFDPAAEHLAFGTFKMKAHGPFISSVIKYLSEYNQAWLKASREGYIRYLTFGKPGTGGNLYGANIQPNYN